MDKKEDMLLYWHQTDVRSKLLMFVKYKTLWGVLLQENNQLQHGYSIYTAFQGWWFSCNSTSPSVLFFTYNPCHDVTLIEVEYAVFILLIFILFSFCHFILLKSPALLLHEVNMRSRTRIVLWCVFGVVVCQRRIWTQCSPSSNLPAPPCLVVISPSFNKTHSSTRGRELADEPS